MPTPRLLILSAPSTGVLDLVTDLTGSAPSPLISGSCAGLTHSWDVETPYYSASVPIWIDEIPEPEEWKAEFTQAEAKEVVEAVGAWVYVFRLEGKGDKEVVQGAEQRLKTVQDVLETHGGVGGDDGIGGAMLAVFLPARKSGEATVLEEGEREELDDVCMQYGFEFVEYAAKGVNAFGEKQGFERVKEALEANGWTAIASADSDDDNGLGFSDNDDNFGAEQAEINAELFGMKASLLSSFSTNNDEDEDIDAAEILASDLTADRQAAQVEDLDVMMSKLLAVREQSAELPEAQRKKMAARAVREIMGE